MLKNIMNVLIEGDILNGICWELCSGFSSKLEHLLVSIFNFKFLLIPKTKEILFVLIFTANDLHAGFFKVSLKVPSRAQKSSPSILKCIKNNCLFITLDQVNIFGIC